MHEPTADRRETDRATEESNKEPNQELSQGKTSRRGFLRLGAAGVAAATLLGTLPGTALSQEPLVQERSPGKTSGGAPAEGNRGALMQEFREAAREYDLPVGILVAMGYVNTRLKMPAPETNDYEEGDLHGWGSYGIMALVRNPWQDTLGEAADLTGIPEEELKRDRRANILGGAALLAESRGRDRQGARPRELVGAASGNGKGKSYEAVTGVGAGDLYAEQLEEVLKRGFSAQVDGERIAIEAGEVVS